MSAPAITDPTSTAKTDTVDRSLRGARHAELARSEVDLLVQRGVQALHAYGNLTQDDVDCIIAEAAVAALDQHGQLAQAAVAETGRGLFEDKAVKNIFACEHVTHSMKGLRTVGVISHDDGASGTARTPR